MQRPEAIANVLNNCINYDKKATPIPTMTQHNNKPWYIRTDLFSHGSIEWIVSFIKNMDVFVVAKSLRYPPMYKMENVLCDIMRCNPKAIDGLSAFNKDDVFIPVDKLRPDMHKKTCIVLMADMTPQELFRSCSRATETLYIIDDARMDIGDPLFPLIINDEYLNNVNKRATGTFGKKKNTDRQYSSTIPTSIIKIQEPMHRLTYKEKDSLRSDINGIAIPIIYEYRTTGKIAIIDIIKNKPGIERYILRFLDNIENRYTIPNILKLSNIYLYVIGRYKSKLYNFSDSEYNWLTEDDIVIYMERLSKYLSKNLEFEVIIGEYRADVFDKDTNTIWEIKCKKYISQQDLNQLSRYATADNFIRSYKLLNVYTEELYCIQQ